MYSGPPAWKQLISPTLAAHERIPLIMTIFSDCDEVDIVGHLCGEDFQTFVDVIDEASLQILPPRKNGSACTLPKLLYSVDQTLDDLPPWIRRRCLRTLYRICSHTALLPRSLAIPLCYNPMENPLCRGGFADVWKGKYRGQDIAAKALRVYSKGNFEKIRRVGRRCSRLVAHIKELTCHL